MSTPPQKHSLEKWTRWAQQGTPSSHWTIAVSDQWYLLTLGALFLIHLGLGATIAPAEDELYYWAWAQKLSLSYFDHPPMTALWIALSTKIFGNSILAIRLPAILAHFFVFFVLGQFPGSKRLLLLVLFTPLSVFGSLLTTPDTPLVVFWVLYLFWLSRIETICSLWSDDPITRVYRKTPVPYSLWVLGGAILGLGLLSKYTMGIAVPCAALLLAMRYRLAAWWKGYFLHLIVAGIFCIPIFLFNQAHAFKPILHQWEHMHWEVDFSFVFSFIGSQIVLVGALPFLLLPWVLLCASETNSNPILRVCFYFFVFPFLFFLYQATRTYLEANWAIVAYLSFFPIAGYLWEKTSFRLEMGIFVLLTFLVPLVATAGILVHLVHPLKVIPWRQDRIARMEETFVLLKQVHTDIESQHANEPLFLPTYQLTSYFKYFGREDAKQLALGRDSHFTMTPSDPCEQDHLLYFVNTADALPEAFKCFSEKSKLSEYPLMVRGEVAETYALYRFAKAGTKP